MRKRKSGNTTRKIVTFLWLGFVLLIFMLPFVLWFVKILRISDAENQRFLLITGLVMLVLGLLWLMLWIARQRSLRVWVAYERYSPVASGIGQRVLLVLAGLTFFAGGAYQVFLTPDQEAEVWEQIREQPDLDSAHILAAPVDTRLSVTGTLSGNATLTSEGVVFFIQEEWFVTPCNILADEECTDTAGFWREINREIPELLLSVAGGTVRTHPVSEVTFGGDFQEWVEPPEIQSLLLMADYQGRRLADGALRVRGLQNGDLLTVVGFKSDSGGIVPSHLIGGGRDQLEAYFGTYTKAVNWVRISGVILMIATPIVTLIVWRELD